MRILYIIFCLFLSAILYAQRTETVEKTILYHADSHLTVNQAKLLAIEEAKEIAIDSVFGTNIRSQSSNVIRLGEGKDINEFVQISSTNIRGRWIKNLKEPQFGKIWYENNMLNIYVTVKGVVKEVKKAPIQCKVKVLCNGTGSDSERDDFKNNNRIYLSFTSPVDGYLVVYLVDDEQNVFRVLPYPNQPNPSYTIKANREYMLFSEKYAFEEDKPYVIEYEMTTNKEHETDLLYVLFSPNKMTRPVDRFVDEEHNPQQTWKDFHKWMSYCMNHDDDMIGEIPIMLTISK